MSAPGKIHSVVLKVAERCNLNCSYCYMYNHRDTSFMRRPVFMDEEIFEQLLLRMREYCDRNAPHRMSFTFHGGEPMLLGARRLKNYAARAHAVLGERLSQIGMQTNATLVDSEWIEVLTSEGIRPGVSLDGPAKVHDATRVDHQGRGSHEQTLRGLRLLQDAGILEGVLCVVNPRLSGIEIYDYFRSLGIKWMSFLLPDVTHDTKPIFYQGLGETPVADYLIPIFDRWFDEDDPAIVVRIFWELLRQILGGKGESDAFGNGPMSYVVVETDGAIQPVDTLRACEHGMIETQLNVMQHGFDDLNLGPPLLYRLVHEGIPLSATCQACPEAVVCGGGYVTHRYARANGFDNPSAWCPDIFKLLRHMRHRIELERWTTVSQQPSSQMALATHS